MAAPSTSELRYYSNKPLTDSDWKTNWDKAVAWLTDGTYDLTVDSVTTTGDITVGGNATITGSVTANSFSGDGSALTGIDLQFKNYFTNGLGNIARTTAYTLVKDAYGSQDYAWYGMATGTAVSAGTFTNTASGNIGRTLFAHYFSGVTLTGTGILYLRYRFNSKDSKIFKNQVCSFSSLVYHNVGSAVNYTVYVRKANALDDFSAVTAISDSGAQSVTSAASTALNYENIAMGDCSNGVEIEIKVEAGAITTKNFQFTELQFEVNATASGYDYKSLELDAINFDTSDSMRLGTTGGVRVYDIISTVGIFVNRGDPSGVDYNSLTIDGAWHDLDLSAIVPAGASAVYLRVYAKDSSVADGDSLIFRKNGNSNSAAIAALYPQANNIGIQGNLIVACDANRIIEYNINTALAAHSVTVLGWFK